LREEKVIYTCGRRSSILEGGEGHLYLRDEKVIYA
jgi:hypothetical protein